MKEKHYQKHLKQNVSFTTVVHIIQQRGSIGD